MKIVGFQKLSLVDFPKKVSCVIFTEGCNYRCPFCYNSSLVYDKSNVVYEEEEILSYLEKRKNVLDAVVISGGEPTLQKDLEKFIKKLRKLPILIKLDTNGTNPEILEKLINEKLIDYVAMDIKNSFDKYLLTTGVENARLDNIRRSIAILKENKVDYEFRTTVVKEFHTKEDIRKIKESIDDSKYYLQNFSDNDNVYYTGLHAFDDCELLDIEKNVKGVTIRGITHQKKEEEINVPC